MAKYELQNGLQFETLPEMKAYIRGLELVRDNFNEELKSTTKFDEWLDDAHSVKANADKPKPQEKAKKKK